MSVFQPEDSLSFLGKEALLRSSKFQNEAKTLKKKSDGQFFRVHTSASIYFPTSCFVGFVLWGLFFLFSVVVFVPFLKLA